MLTDHLSSGSRYAICTFMVDIFNETLGAESVSVCIVQRLYKVRASLSQVAP